MLLLCGYLAQVVYSSAHSMLGCAELQRLTRAAALGAAEQEVEVDLQPDDEWIPPPPR